MTAAPVAAAVPIEAERPPATVPLPNGLGYAVTAIYLASAVALLVSITGTGVSWSAALNAHQLHNIDLAAVIGALILRRHQGHLIGWLLIGVGAFETPVLLSRAYHFLGLPGGAAAENRLGAFFVPGTFLLLVAVPQLFPDGRPLSRRWLPLLGFGMLASAWLTVEFYIELSMNEPATSWHSAVSFLLFGVAVLASILPVSVRFRRSRGIERQQFKWVSYGLVISGIMEALAAIQITGGESTANTLLTLVAQGIIPLAFAVALLRYRLYDVDLVINKTVVFAALAAFITAVYAVVVVGLGALLPIGDHGLTLSLTATALVAVAFEPVRVRVQHAANVLVYGRRATPYEALAAMTASLGDVADPGAALSETARLLAEGTGAARATVWVAQADFLDPVGTAGDPDGPARLRLDDGELPAIPGAGLVVPVHHEAHLIGALSLTKRAGEGVSRADHALVRDLAGQMTLLLTNTRLRVRLRERLDELRASRRRLLAAQDQARHTLERDLHDGAQQEVIACKIRLGLARTIAAQEGANQLAEALEAAAAIADQAMDALRGVAHGIYPPLLESEGLATALRSLARRAGISVTLLDRGTGRYPHAVESTVYFCAVEAVGNAVQHARANAAHIELDDDGSTLTLSVSDDGTGFDPERTPFGAGLTHMVDRADAGSGGLRVTSHPAHGTTVVLTLPYAQAE